MAIGTSSGAYYDTDFHHEAGINTDPSVDNNVVTPKETPTDDIVAPPGKVELDKATKPTLTPVSDQSRLYVSPQKDYDTKLTHDEENAYQSKYGNDPNTTQDYDMRGYYKANPDVDPNAPGTHYPDTFKKPSHPTFSDESMYHSEETPGGHWTKGEGDSWTFRPSTQNIRNGLGITKEYLERSDPNVKLDLPNIEDVPHHDNIEKSFQDLWQALKLPGDVYKGKIDMSSPEGIKRAVDLTLMMSPLSAGHRGTIIPPEGVNTRVSPDMPTSEAVSRVRNQPSNIGEDVSREEMLRGASNEELQAKIQNYDQHVMHGPLGDIHEGAPNIELERREGATARSEGRTPLSIDERPPNNHFNQSGMTPSQVADEYMALRSNRGSGEADRYLDNFERHAARHELNEFDTHLEGNFSSSHPGYEVEDYHDPIKDIKNWDVIGSKKNMNLLENPHSSRSPFNHSFGFMTDDGKVGTLSVSELNDGKKLYVNGIFGENGSSVRDFGHKEMKALLSILMDEFPKMEKIAGFRVSGARGKVGSTGNAEMRVRPSSEPPRKDIDQMIQEWDESSPQSIMDRNTLSPPEMD